MPETQEPESAKKRVGEQVEKLTDGIGGVVRATTEATAEVASGAVRVATGFVSDASQSFADMVAKAVADSTDVAQRGVRRLFSLDSATEVKAEQKPEQKVEPKKKE